MAAADLAPAPEPVLRPAGARSLRLGAAASLVVHLTVRQLRSSHHLTLLGWGWPVARQLAQLAVLVFLFGHVFDLNVKNYPVFVFVGLLAWTWFSSAITGASQSALGQRHLVMQPRLPSYVLPVVAIAVPFVDVLFALPVLAIMLIASTGLGWGVFVCPLLLVTQFLLLAGLAWLVAAVSVFFRDVPNLVAVALMILFYLTPVFYSREIVPERFRFVLDLNPMATIIASYRALLLDAPGPGAASVAALGVLSVAMAVVGYRVYVRLAPHFPDRL